MKVIYFVVVLLIGCSSAELNPAKRSLTCSGFPKQLSGRLYMKAANCETTICSFCFVSYCINQAEVDESGSSETVEISFNLDLNLQLMQEETADGILIMDFKEGKLYEKGPEGCHSEPLEEKIMPELLEDMPLKLIATGSLGNKGASVDCYSFQDEGEGVGVVVLESGDQCIPVRFALKTKNSATTGSFLDLKTTILPEKLKIPDECKQAANTRRSLADVFEFFNDPLFQTSRATPKRRGFPWIVPQKKSKKSKGK